jgi:hypothetical protein
MKSFIKRIVLPKQRKERKNLKLISYNFNI